MSVNDKNNWRFFKKSPFSSKYSYGHINCSFHNLAHKFSAKFEKSSAQGPMMIEGFIFPKKAVFVKMFLWTSRIQFWQTRRKILDEGRKKFDRCRRKLQKKIFPSFSSGKFLRTRGMQLCKTCRKVSVKMLKINRSRSQ